MYSADARSLARSLRQSALAADRETLVRHWSEPALRAAVRSGDVARVLPQIFAGAEHAEAVTTRIHATELWIRERGVIIGAAAAFARGLLTESPTTVQVTAPFGMNAPGVSWLTLVRTAAPIPTSRHPMRGWVSKRIAEPAYAVVTAYRELGPDRGSECVYAAAREGKVTLEDLVGAMNAMPRLKGRRSLRRLFDAIAAGSESHLETLGLREVFHSAEFRHFLRQHRLVLDGQSFRLDMFDPSTRTAVELDGGTHADPRRRERDIERDALLNAHGIATVRFSYGQITRSPDRCRRIVRRALDERSAVLGMQRPGSV